VDQVLHYEHDPARYCAVSRKGVWYKVDMVVKGKNGKWRTALLHELEQQFEYIIKDSDAKPAPDGENAIAALTGWHRGRWAEAREHYFWEGVNKESLSMIEKAFCHLHLYDETPADMQKQAKSLLHADGKTLWFDKSVTFATYPNGKAGMMAEHSYADALTVAHMWEWVTTEERMNGGMYRDDGHAKGYQETSTEQVNLMPPLRMTWNLESDCKKVIAEAVTANQELCNDLDLVIMTHDAFGKGFMKKARISPDAFFQIAMQLAYKRDSGGKRALTYEASVTRLFAQGRTETVRSLSNESAAFVDAMMDPSTSAAERVEKLQAAADKHASLYKSAMVGDGIDRHLFGLYIVSVGLGYDSQFLKSALKMPWTLSTSQTPQKQTEGRWNPEKTDKHTISPGGGFGPVADDGYGVSYMFPNDDVIYAHISSKKSASNTSSQRFQDNITAALADMKKTVEQHMAEVKAKKSG
jgi:carnitine O-palmitoyltransferase 1